MRLLEPIARKTIWLPRSEMMVGPAVPTMLWSMTPRLRASSAPPTISNVFLVEGVLVASVGLVVAVCVVVIGSAVPHQAHGIVGLQSGYLLTESNGVQSHLVGVVPSAHDFAILNIAYKQQGRTRA